MKHIAVFDVGKTNKKLLVFDEQYRVVHELSKNFDEIKDEDGFACENIEAVSEWIVHSFEEIINDNRFSIAAVNFSGYGASFVHVDENGKAVLPLYNYLKPYSPVLQKQFYDKYGGEHSVSKQTASPVLGNLNSGMQLYRLKYEKAIEYANVKYSLHLPQYLSFLLTSIPVSDITSIGCHTNLWNFADNKYHEWVAEENIEPKLAPIESAAKAIPVQVANKKIVAGIGLHDSSSALIPYLCSFNEPFILLSTGTWCISLNPFNHSTLSDYELHNDCLCYLSFTGKPVKASRLFAGYEHEQQVKRLAEHFQKEPGYYKKVVYNPSFINKNSKLTSSGNTNAEVAMVKQSQFENRRLEDFKSYEEAYHQLIADIIVQQVRSTKLVLSGTGVKKIFVDGGFGMNPVFMNLLAESFPDCKVYAAAVGQASALGAALVIHEYWNANQLPGNLIELKQYPAVKLQ
ncbi:MAG: carbohydrate kinase [Chitinophagaceae bacterium]|nr:carbohydrate kinase [Chitinophagaceae bacterium]